MLLAHVIESDPMNWWQALIVTLGIFAFALIVTVTLFRGRR